MSESGGEQNKILKAIGFIAGAIGISYLFYRLYFLRHPERKIPNSNKLFVSPAQGTVISVRPFDSSKIVETKDEPFSERGAIEILTSDVAAKGTIVSIRLQITDVHYQRAPMTGQVLSTEYAAGSFKNAVIVPDEGTRYENEHNSILLQTESGIKYKVVQIAGILARSIECSVVPAQLVSQGEIIGLINLGSQVAVIFPDSVNVVVKAGDKVVDGETVIANVQ